jgi:ABC-type polysaccharide/polyol phosphate export permease
MNASRVAARAGARRGWIELKHTFTTPNDLVTLLIFTAILLGVMLWTRTTTVPGTHFSLGTAMLAISGVFYPITHLPHWLQWAGQAFPLYRLGLGTRSALLPANLASVEIGHSWRHLATFGVLSAWAVAGLLVAPILLRWVARRESGSSVAARREKVLRQVAG